MNTYSSKIDLEARKKVSSLFREKFVNIVDSLFKNVEPEMLIPKRTLSNTIYDPVKKLLLLGDEKLSRKFFDMHESRKFMQTILMASIIYQA
ncbi:MAG: DNA topoisomerase VI, partial [Desulfurococcales archaeon]|nr:DNA topoisomerase VI [Desulfurococcales archaeon]